MGRATITIAIAHRTDSRLIPNISPGELHARCYAAHRENTGPRRASDRHPDLELGQRDLLLPHDRITGARSRGARPSRGIFEGDVLGRLNSDSPHAFSRKYILIALVLTAYISWCFLSLGDWLRERSRGAHADTERLTDMLKRRSPDRSVEDYSLRLIFREVPGNLICA